MAVVYSDSSRFRIFLLWACVWLASSWTLYAAKPASSRGAVPTSRSSVKAEAGPRSLKELQRRTDDLVSDYTGGIRNMEGTSETADCLLRDYGTALDRLYSRCHDDAELLKMLGAGYRSLGQLAEIYRDADALPLYQRAVTLSQRLVRNSPADTQVQKDLAFAYERLARCQHISEEKEAFRLYQQALAIRRRLAETHPQDISLQRELMNGYFQTGRFRWNMESVTGNEPVPPAKEFLEKGIRLAEKLARENPRDVQAKRDLIRGYVEVAEARLPLFGVAPNQYSRQALAWATELAKSNPKDWQIQNELANCCQCKADVISMERQGTAEELEALMKALSIRRAVVAACPNNARIRENLMRDYLCFSIWYDTNKDRRNWEKYLRYERDGYKSLTAVFPGNLRLNKELIRCDYELANLAFEPRKGTKEQRTLFAEIVETNRRLSGVYPENADIQCSLGESYGALGGAYEDQGNMDKAVSCYRKELEAVMASVRISPDWAFVFLTREHQPESLGKKLIDCGMKSQAFDYYQFALELIQVGLKAEMKTGRKDESAWDRSIDIGLFFMSNGQSQLAAHAFQQADQILQRLQTKPASFRTATKHIEDQSTEGGELTAFFDEDEMRAFSLDLCGELGKSEACFVLRNGKLAVVCETEYTYDRPFYQKGYKVTSRRDRYLRFSGGKLMEILNVEGGKSRIQRSDLKSEETGCLATVKETLVWAKHVGKKTKS